MKAILEVLALEDVTPKNELVSSPEDSKALQVIGKSRKFRFSSANIPIGATLNFVKDLSLVAQVQDDTSVLFDGANHSLSTAALGALKHCGYDWTSVQGPEYWLYNGETVGSLRAQQRELQDRVE